jgi:hypothetical protein
VAAATLTVLGLIYESEGVATIGALGIVASLVLPRMKGVFEFGPGGFKGATWDDYFEEVLKQGAERGLTPSEAAEVATAELEAPSDSLVGMISEIRDQLAHAVFAQVATARVDEAVEHEAEVRRTIESALEYNSTWRLRTDVGPPPQATLNLDYVLDTGKGLVLIETLFAKQFGNTVHLKSYALARAKDALGADRAFLVVPNDARIGVGEREGTMVLRPIDLWVELQVYWDREQTD